MHNLNEPHAIISIPLVVIVIVVVVVIKIRISCQLNMRNNKTSTLYLNFLDLSCTLLVAMGWVVCLKYH